jgi:hypothetical protein
MYTRRIQSIELCERMLKLASSPKSTYATSFQIYCFAKYTVFAIVQLRVMRILFRVSPLNWTLAYMRRLLTCDTSFSWVVWSNAQSNVNMKVGIRHRKVTHFLEHLNEHSTLFLRGTKCELESWNTASQGDALSWTFERTQYALFEGNKMWTWKLEYGIARWRTFLNIFERTQYFFFERNNKLNERLLSKHKQCIGLASRDVTA